MIPLKITVEGFLSYRKRTVLDFTGHPLWMLYGRNGSGKTAIFDAITYALFGEHRAGKRSTQLITQGEDRLLVEFDFRLGTERYRIRRTHARHTNKPTCHIAHVAPNGAVDIIEGTEQVRLFDDWITHYIGMNYNAFTAAVLLRQGKSDKLVGATPAERHAIIGQLIDIAQYERLHDRAEQHAKDARRHLESLRDDIERLALVTNEEITNAAGDIDTKHANHRELNATRDAWLRLADAVIRWGRATQKHIRLSSDLAEMDEQLTHATNIERDHERYLVLSRTLPHLSHVITSQSDLTETAKKRAQLAADREQIAARYCAAETVLQHARQHTEHSRAKCEAQEQQIIELLKQQNDLLPHVQHMQQLTQIREQLAHYEAELTAFPATLEAMLQEAEAAVNLSRDAQIVSPFLAQFVSDRVNWQEFQDKAEQTHNQLTTLLAQVPIGFTSEAFAQQAHDEYTRTQQQCNDLRRKLDNFDKLDGKSVCEQCGQPLDPAHLTTERQRLASELQQACLQAEESAKRQEVAVQLARDIQQVQRDHDRAVENRRHHEHSVVTVLAEMPSAMRHRIEGDEAILHLILARVGYPTSQDLADVREQCAQLPTRQKRLQHLTHQREKKMQIQAQCTALSAQETELAVYYSREQCATYQRQAQITQAQLDEHQAQKEGLQARLHSAKEHQQICEQQMTMLTNQMHVGETELARCEEAHAQHTEQLQRYMQDCPCELGDPFQITKDHYDRWEQELGILQEAPVRWQGLVQARERRDMCARELSDTQTTLAAIHTEAHISEADYQQRCDLLTTNVAIAQQTLQEAQTLHRTLCERQQQRQQREKEAVTADRHLERWRRLETLLDREHLQHQLLLQAEGLIVDFANETLAVISNHTLRLTLQSESQHSFELLAYDQKVGGDTLSLKLLSGSQQFRVSFSLAMGIGRYLTAGRHTPEAVFIDEGFGSLDQEGRQQMIAEIETLGQHLECIILVSHQDEFAQAFPHAYHIQHNGETATACYIVIDDVLSK